MADAELLKSLEAIVGSDRIKTSPEDLLTYSYDAYVKEYLPEVVLFPKSTKEVAGILKLANERGVPVTPRGSGTNLSGGSVPKKGGIILCFTMMNRLLEINRANRYAVVEPGLVVSEFQKEVEKIGLFYPPDPGSSAVATMGGTVLMNAGGMRGIKYGATRDYLLGLEIVLASGEMMDTGGITAKDVTGYDLTRLICGSEGTLAAVTKIIVRLLPKPKTRRTMQAIYNRIDDAGTTVAKIIEAGIIPASLELMDNQIIKAVEDFAHLGLPLDAEAVLLIDVDGDPETVEKQAKVVGDFCKAHRARDVKVSQSEKENEQLWVARRSVFGAVARLRPTCIVEDATVPVSMLTEAVKKIREISERNRVQIAVVAHAGDGNLHPLVLCDIRDKEEMARVEMAFEEFVDYALSLGGTLSGEHGIGISKAKYLSKQLSPTVIAMTRAIKKTFDPKGILNPGSFLEYAE